MRIGKLYGRLICLRTIRRVNKGFFGIFFSGFVASPAIITAVKERLRMTNNTSSPIPADRLVWVTWQDAVSQRQDPEQQSSLALNVNLGWPGFHTKSCYSLINGVSSTGELDVLNIPIENIVRVEGAVSGRSRSCKKAACSRRCRPRVSEKKK